MVTLTRAGARSTIPTQTHSLARLGSALPDWTRLARSWSAVRPCAARRPSLSSSLARPLSSRPKLVRAFALDALESAAGERVHCTALGCFASRVVVGSGVATPPPPPKRRSHARTHSLYLGAHSSLCVSVRKSASLSLASDRRARADARLLLHARNKCERPQKAQVLRKRLQYEPPHKWTDQTRRARVCCRQNEHLAFSFRPSTRAKSDIVSGETIS